MRVTIRNDEKAEAGADGELIQVLLFNAEDRDPVERRTLAPGSQWTATIGDDTGLVIGKPGFLDEPDESEI